MNVKLFVLLTKVTPMIIAFVHLVNIILSYHYCNDIPLNYLGGISILSIAYLYIASYTFKLCHYHRMFLHYSVLVDIINVYDFYIGIPISDLDLYQVLLTISIVTMFVIIYLKFFK